MSEFAYLNLRGDQGKAGFVAAVESVLGQSLPVLANTMSIDKHRIYWRGPDEWLVVAKSEGLQALLAEIRQELQDHQAAVTDVSGGEVLLRLKGENVRKVLASGSTLDFHPDVFRVGQCAQSGLARAVVLIGHIDDQPSYEIIVRRSFSEYLMLWLRAPCQKYSVQLSVI